MEKTIEGKTILVTGGTGSFGNKVALHLKQHNPSRIIIFSRDEKKQYEMAKDHPGFEYIIGNIRDKQALLTALHGVDYVFHAAALKQVPTCEVHPYEAVKTNILGSQNLCEAAIEKGVKRVVGLSTDKAVKPINAMGISKSMMEKIICAQNQKEIETVFSCVRYGNVMGSRGSVIPLFKKQIEKGEDITITHPDMTRFMMSLDDSVDLVLHALTKAEGGEVFVKKAPAAKVIDLAKTMLKKYGDSDEDRIKVVGIRPGEKMDEVLVNEYEITRAHENEAFFEISPEYRRKESNNSYPHGYEYTSSNTQILTAYDEISELLETIGKTEFYA